MAKQDIRKISIGSGGHPDNMMHYQVGVEYNLSGTKYKLTDIHLDKELLQLGKVVYNLYLQEPDGAKVIGIFLTVFGYTKCNSVLYLCCGFIRYLLFVDWYLCRVYCS